MPKSNEDLKTTDKLATQIETASPEPDAKTTSPDENMSAPPEDPVADKATAPAPDEPIDTDPHRGKGGAYYIDPEDGVRKPVPTA